MEVQDLNNWTAREVSRNFLNFLKNIFRLWLLQSADAEFVDMTPMDMEGWWYKYVDILHYSRAKHVFVL